MLVASATATGSEVAAGVFVQSGPSVPLGVALPGSAIAVAEATEIGVATKPSEERLARRLAASAGFIVNVSVGSVDVRGTVTVTVTTRTDEVDDGESSITLGVDAMLDDAVGKATVLLGLVATRPPSTPAAFMSDNACASLTQSRICTSRV